MSGREKGELSEAGEISKSEETTMTEQAPMAARMGSPGKGDRLA